MKQLLGSFLLLCACVPLAAGEANQKRRVKEQAQAMADAFLKGDIEKFASYVHPKILKLVGGRDEMVAKIKTSLEDMKAKGIALKSYKIQAPSDIAGKGQERYAVVPFTMVMTFPGKKYTQRGVMVAVTEDGGKRWTFVNTESKTAKDVRRLLPNLPKDLKLPPPQKPMIEDTK